MPSSESSQQGQLAEEAAARKYGLDGAGGPGFADLQDDDGRLYSVKSTVHRRADGSPGRFRFQRENFRRLHREHRSAVILVLFPQVHGDRGLTNRSALNIVSRPTADVAEAIHRRGGWTIANHASFTYQARVPWPALIDR